MAGTDRLYDRNLIGWTLRSASPALEALERELERLGGGLPVSLYKAAAAKVKKGVLGDVGQGPYTTPDGISWACSLLFNTFPAGTLLFLPPLQDRVEGAEPQIAQPARLYTKGPVQDDRLEILVSELTAGLRQAYIERFEAEQVPAPPRPPRRQAGSVEYRPVPAVHPLVRLNGFIGAAFLILVVMMVIRTLLNLPPSPLP